MKSSTIPPQNPRSAAASRTAPQGISTSAQPTVGVRARVRRMLECAWQRLRPAPRIDNIYPILGGHIYFQTLSAAVEFDLFSRLDREPGLTMPEIAQRLGIEQQPARILLLGCTTLGLLRKSGDAYENSRLASRYLVRGRPGNLVAVVEWQHFINYRAMYSFAESLRQNSNVGLDEFKGDEPTLYERLTHHPNLEQIFQNAMEGISVQANAMLARHVDFSHIRRLVDVGGGNGTNCMALVRRYPQLHATVFDSPSVCQIARAHVAEAGLSHRVDAVAGNCFEDDFPKGVDCILFGHFFTIWSEEKNRRLLRKAHEALAPGGSVIVFNMMQHDDGTGPMTAALGSPYFLALATGEGMLYCWREYEAWMRDAGFGDVRVQKLPRDHGAIIGTKRQ